MTLNLNTMTNREALEAILRGLQTKHSDIDAHLRDLRSQLNGDAAESRKNVALKQLTATHEAIADAWYVPLYAGPRPAVAQLVNGKEAKPAVRGTQARKFVRSAAVRKRMAESQRARWAKVKG